MAGYTKEDFDTLYSIRARIYHSETNSFERTPIRLHYSRVTMYRDFVIPRWTNLISKLNLIIADKIIIVGAGFGWGVEELIAQTGCVAVGTDISDYVHSVKILDERTDIEAAIVAAGFDPTSGKGLYYFNNLYDSEIRTKSVVLNEDMTTAKSRNNIKQFLGDSNPTWVITEDMLSDFTDKEATDLTALADKFATSNTCHFVRENTGANPKTLEEWNTLTGATIVGVGNYRRVG